MDWEQANVVLFVCWHDASARGKILSRAEDNVWCVMQHPSRRAMACGRWTINDVPSNTCSRISQTCAKALSHTVVDRVALPPALWSHRATRAHRLVNHS